MQVQHAALAHGAIDFRGYQANLARIAAKQDTLVVLPTGLGKTIVAVLVLADALTAGARRALFMAPTKPLVEQHAAFLQRALAPPWNDRVHVLTGATAPKQREARYAEEGIFCATPQVIQNDVVAGRLDIADLDWIVFDEAHRAVGDYAYTFLGEEASRRRTAIRRMALTASPGHDAAKVEEVLHNLGIGHVEIRTPFDPDVAPYVQETRIDWETLPLPPGMARVSRRLQDALSDRVRHLRDGGWLPDARRRPTRRTLLDCAHRLQAVARDRSDVPPEVYAALSVQAQAMKLLHAIELAETQGSDPFRAFIDKLRKEAAGPKPSKATLRVLDDKRITEAYHIAGHDVEENPKMGRTQVLVQEQLDRDADSRCIVFANYRDTCESIATRLGALAGVRPVVFVGQGRRGGREGLTQKQQQQVLAAFRAGEHNVLVATSVAEEGLDIPSTDLVVFYEPIGSEIRSIQRRGRTGRHGTGRVVVLMTKGTQDEAAHWSAQHKEKQMVQELQGLRHRLSAPAAPPTAVRTTAPTTRPSQATLDDEANPAPVSAAGAAARVVCDHREQAGAVVKHLHTLGLGVEMKQLDIGDYVVSDRVVVERKATADFVDSLLDQRLFPQLKAMQAYPKPFLVVEGGSLLGHRNVSPEALHGALASITIDFGITVLQTRDALETARFLAAVAKREQSRGGRRIAIRPGRAAMDDTERLRHVLAGFPRIDEARAQRLLDHFGSLRAVFDADAKALADVDGIGPTIAADLQRLLDEPAVRSLAAALADAD